jgi:hypothetical protein
MGIDFLISRRAPIQEDRKAQQNPSLHPIHHCRAATTHPKHQRPDAEEDGIVSPP